MHEFIIAKNEKGTLDIKPAIFDDYNFAKLDVPEHDLVSACKQITEMVRIVWDTDSYKTKTVFRFE